MDSIRSSNSKIPLFKITKIESSSNESNQNAHTITSNSDTLSEVTFSSVSSKENTKEFHSGKWSQLENFLFIEGVLLYGNNWKKIQENIVTRTTTQARSHAQKIFLKLQSKNIVKIDNHVNTIQEFFKVLKKFPPEDFQRIYHQIIEIANENYNAKTIHKKRIPKKRKLFSVIHNINNDDIKNDNRSGFNDKTERTFNSTSSYKNEEEECLDELLSQDDIIDINKPINELDVFFSHL